jgi:hypothetical protein
MKKKRPILLLLLVVTALVGFWLHSRNNIKNSVSVTFLYYTNSDTRGFNDKYTWAWFRIENKSSFRLQCQQGPLDFERDGTWLRDASRVGFSYSSVEAGGTVTISLMPPERASRWRNSLHLTRIVLHSKGHYSRRIRFQNFMNRLSGGFRFQWWQSKVPDPVVVTSNAIDL